MLFEKPKQTPEPEYGFHILVRVFVLLYKLDCLSVHSVSFEQQSVIGYKKHVISRKDKNDEKNHDSKT